MRFDYLDLKVFSGVSACDMLCCIVGNLLKTKVYKKVLRKSRKGVSFFKVSGYLYGIDGLHHVV